MTDVGGLLDELQIDLIIAGFPKCGTTSFAAWLDSDPGVALSRPKETFLLTPAFGRTAILPSEGVFGHARKDQRRIEASSLGIYSPHLLNALRDRPHIQVIALYREPWKATQSWHQQMVNATLAETSELEANLKQEPIALEESADLLCNYRTVLGYGTALEQWERTLSPGQMLVLRTDELASTEHADAPVRSRIESFADLHPEGAVPVANSFHQRRFPGLYASIRNAPLLQPVLRRIRYGRVSSGLIERTARAPFLEDADKPDHASAWVELFADEFERAESVRQRNQESLGRSVL